MLFSLHLHDKDKYQDVAQGDAFLDIKSWINWESFW